MNTGLKMQAKALHWTRWVPDTGIALVFDLTRIFGTKMAVLAPEYGGFQINNL